MGMLTRRVQLSMDRDALLKIFDQEQRIDVNWPGVTREVVGHVVRHLTPQQKTGFIVYSHLEAATADAEIDETVAYFDAQGFPFEWKVYDHDSPADLRRRLAARGFTIEPPEALMVLDLEDAPEFYASLVLPDELYRVEDAAGIDDLVRMEEAVWETDQQWLGKDLAHNLASVPDLLSIFAIQAEGRVVSAAWIYYHPPSQFGSLWGGSTLPAYRKRGYYTALLVARAREAKLRGYRFLTVDASPMSRPILEKHGFQFLGFSTPCKWTPKAPEGG